MSFEWSFPKLRGDSDSDKRSSSRSSRSSLSGILRKLESKKLRSCKEKAKSLVLVLWEPLASCGGVLPVRARQPPLNRVPTGERRPTVAPEEKEQLPWFAKDALIEKRLSFLLAEPDISALQRRGTMLFQFP